ncbi:MAG TPA: glycosyltransferase family 4 protein [Thermoplasmata archaeon]|nr:glycosyltransferase family 4 protein [Thermoplasmata archaeon]
MNIAEVALRFDAPGGVETNVREVATRLVRKGHQVRVFASDLYDESGWQRRPDSSRSVDGVPVERFAVYKRLIPGLTLPLMPGLIAALARSGADVVHAHSHRYGHVLQAFLASRATGVPFVVSTHYHPADRREPPFKRGMLRIQDVGFGATAYRGAAAIVVETELEADLVAEFAPRRKIAIVPPGIDLAEWTDHTSAVRPDGLPARYLLFSGRVAPNKGLTVLLRALAQMAPAERIPLVILGRDWGEREELERLARQLGVADRIVWLGHLDDRAAYRTVFRCATLFVLPSEWEAFGLVLLEAMAAGVPIIATQVGGVPEVLGAGQYGTLVPYGDVPALAQAIQRSLDRPEAMRATAARASERVRRFDWDRSVERLEEVFVRAAETYEGA